MPSNITSLEAELFDTQQPPAEERISLILAELKRSGKLNEKDKEGNTYLMRAVLTGNVRVARSLIAVEADETLHNKQGLTALMLAAQLGNKDMVTLLCIQGYHNSGQYNYRYKYVYEGPSIYYYQMRSKKERQTPLMLAVIAGHEDIVDMLMGAQYLETSKKLRTNKQGQTVLMLAAQGSNIEILKKVCKQAANLADFNKKDKAGKSALMYAMESNRKENAIYLIAQGADFSHFGYSDASQAAIINASVDLLFADNKPEAARALLYKAMLHYGMNQSVALQFKYRLAEYDYTHRAQPFGFQEGGIIPSCVQYALELDSNQLDGTQKALKEQILKDYWFTDKLDDSNYRTKFLPIIEQSHFQPRAVYMGIKELRAGIAPEQANTQPKALPKLTDKQSEDLKKLIHIPSDPSWFSRMWEQFFPKPSDAQTLKHVLLKGYLPWENKQEQVISVLKKILSKKESIPSDLIRDGRYRTEILKALEAIAQEPLVTTLKPMSWVGDVGGDLYAFEYDFYDFSGAHHRGRVQYPQKMGFGENSQNLIEAFLLNQQITQGWVMNDEYAAYRAYEILGECDLERVPKYSIESPNSLQAAFLHARGVHNAPAAGAPVVGASSAPGQVSQGVPSAPVINMPQQGVPSAPADPKEASALPKSPKT